MTGKATTQTNTAKRPAEHSCALKDPNDSPEKRNDLLKEIQNSNLSAATKAKLAKDIQEDNPLGYVMDSIDAGVDPNHPGQGA